jgi:putative transposase
VTALLKGHASFSREGNLTAWVVIWAMIFQRLHPKGTLSVAVRELLTGPVQKWIHWPKGKTRRRLSANTSAYSQARSRLPLEVAEQVSDLIFQSLTQQPKILPGLDRPLFLLDGSSLLLTHGKELAAAYPPAANQHGVSHWPVMRVMVAHDVVSGLATRPAGGPMYGDAAISEQALAKTIIGRLPAQSAIMGDRNLGVFSMAYHAGSQNHPCLFRLTEVRARKLNRGATPNANTDKAFRWHPSRHDLRNNREIPVDASVAGRLLAFKIHVGGKRQKLYLFTTLPLSAEEILQLYGYRWNIETDLRSLKREVRLHMLNVQSPAMAEKELVLGVAAYNLTRAAINDAAAALNCDPREFSFSLAQDTLNAFLPLFDKASQRESIALMQEMLRVFSYSRLPRRHKHRSAPRMVWPRRCSFPKHKLPKPGGR